MRWQEPQFETVRPALADFIPSLTDQAEEPRFNTLGPPQASNVSSGMTISVA